MKPARRSDALRIELYNELDGDDERNGPGVGLRDDRGRAFVRIDASQLVSKERAFASAPMTSGKSLLRGRRLMTCLALI